MSGVLNARPACPFALYFQCAAMPNSAMLVAHRAGQREVYLKQIVAEINDDLKDLHIEAYVTGRPKDYFSIYQKMIVRGHDFSDIYDLVGVRRAPSSARSTA